jgi:hypothetical protein
MKQRQYLQKLRDRNAQLIPGGDQGRDGVWFEGLSRPMSPAERKMRQRIRRNSISAMFDLVLVGNAGVLPGPDQRKEGVTCVSGMLAQASDAMILRMVTGET